MPPTEPDDIGRLATAIASELAGSPDSPVEGGPQVVAQVIDAVLRENFRIEEQILREAEKTLADLGAAASGMDRRKLLGGIRERIAKKRGFVL
jgi:hypothetical protein